MSSLIALRLTFATGSLSESEAHWLSQTDWPGAPGLYRSPHADVTDVHCQALLCVYISDVNADPHACMAALCSLSVHPSYYYLDTCLSSFCFFFLLQDK